jgi:enoyl-CoA hydratase/carnithine racemase
MTDAAEPTDLKYVQYEVLEPHIVRVTLNRPERRNAIKFPEMNAELGRAIEIAENDDDVKVVILRGAGDHFCSGEDVTKTPVETFGLGKGKRLEQSKRIRGITRNLDDDIMLADKTVIAAVRGAALGLGFKIALSCDLIIASDDARFGRPQTRLGLGGMDMFLPIVLLRLGINRGYEAILTGRTIMASELADWGVVSSVVPAADLEDESLRYARAVAAHSADGLMIGRKALQLFWSTMGYSQWNAFAQVAHPLFTNLVWREDEASLFRERARTDSMSGALKAVYQRWEDLGFE